MIDGCWCRHKIKQLEEMVRRGILKSDYGKTEVKTDSGWELAHEWTVSAAGTKWYCHKGEHVRSS